MKIYNTLTRQKQNFTPITPNTVKMYTCGQTVYNNIHMGNARFYVVYDAIRRYLEHCGYTVEYVQNFTDIDDKTIARANEEGISPTQIAEKYIASTLQDLENLNIKAATVNPRVTQEIPAIVEMVAGLVNTNHAYEKGGTVYFDITSFPQYGKLSHRNIEDLEAGARVEVEADKKNPADFVLWKPAKPGEPSWPSPWGNGRPGWHIECSAMIRKYLGDEIDIHGGGTDLIFPHHENEIAQTEALTDKNLARYWMHCGMITVDHKKMSKSRGNFATLQEVAEKYPYDVIRFFFLSVHYRMPMEFTDVALNAAQQGLQRIKNCYNNLEHLLSTGPPVITDERTRFIGTENNRDRVVLKIELLPSYNAFFNAMDNDFNTADAITAIFELVKHINILPSSTLPLELYELQNHLVKLMGILGINLKDNVANSSSDSEEDENIEALITARQTARKNKDFAESDRIRDELANMGIVLEDTREGVRWHRA